MAVDAVVMGLGYVGMPLVHAAVHAGLTVAGFDVSRTVVDGLMDGRSHIDDLSDDDVAAIRERGFRATSDEAVLADADAIVICVPTPLDEDTRPNVGAVESAARAIARNLTPGTLVVLESTTYPGTTEELVQPLLEESGLRAGVDFHLAFSPERIDPGNPTYGLVNTPKIVGGLTPQSTERARAFYGRFVDTTIAAKGPREAETAKLLENTYRHVNIALVNEMAQFCHELDIDLWNAIDMASTKPFGFQAFYPGPGVGGHCIPIDPNYLSYNVKSRLGYPFRFVELAQEINSSMPAYVVRRVQDILNDDAKALRGAKILLLGVTYKPNISDRRESPAIPLAEALLEHGADLSYHDPNIDEWTAAGRQVPRADDALRAAPDADVVVVVQNHREYDIDALARVSKRFLDTKGKVTADGAQRL
ncbi:nucleotide sugar dehydrogenase [Brevibacterium jeotgali]|uniref:Nucleotide sugar dehydrogenase n=1 Tax=Brevibacterium jeotgali TaxID=1262550 RepID=A0A2H1L8G1_9MICO|nr:nucleotide sugar dehydrogenase [Brevibacterium jeotgali]TWB98828.1 nucleotide sugar dehydrogenase [Brevibacterium jeotgali]SMY13186.1 nucleotide sugar dehydrogenase [Brevibacterium jeotgali]